MPNVVYVDLIKDEPPAVEGHEPNCPWQNSDCEYKATHHYCPHPEHECKCVSEARSKFQPYRWHATSAGNHEIVGHGERYFNETDAENAIRLQFSTDTIVYLRRHEQGNELLRMAYPNNLGQEILLGPGVIANAERTVINWDGTNYYAATTGQTPRQSHE